MFIARVSGVGRQVWVKPKRLHHRRCVGKQFSEMFFSYLLGTTFLIYYVLMLNFSFTTFYIIPPNDIKVISITIFL